MKDSPKERGPSLHLDILEDLFGKAYARFRPSRADLQRQAGGSFADEAAKLADLEVALVAVASTFAGKHLSLRPAEAAGGLLEGVLLLPRQVALAPEAAANRELYFVRAALGGEMVAKAVQQSEADLAGSAASEARVLMRAMASACRLAERYEGFRTRAAAVAQLELGTRPEPESLPIHEQPLEVLRQAALEQLGSWSHSPDLWSDESGADLDSSPESAEPATRSGPAPLERLAPQFVAALAAFDGLSSDAFAGPRRSFFHRLMRSGPPAPIGPGPLLLLGGSLTPTDRDAAAAALTESEASATNDAVEHEAPARDHVRETTVDEDPYKENTPSHSFEKIDFADNYEGGFRKLDGADDMEEQAESLDGVDLREMIRGGPEVQTIYNAEIGDVGEIPDVMNTLPGERGVTYDEWDHAKGRYKRDWVTLYPTRIDTRHVDFGMGLARELKTTTRRAIRALEVHRTERILRNRQLDGDEVDLEGVIEEYAERRRGGSPPGRVYVRSPRLERDIATCVMLDVSFSADSWVQNQRVLDVELAAACVLGEVADELEDQFSILAFASNTRNLCRTWTVKDWSDSWSTGRARLGALKPQGYTRIGPAIRHGTAQLTKHPARKKHLILVTDGKPTDFDRYEGGHGIHDVAWAVREARRNEVSVHALGIDPRAASILPTMFGPGGWRVLRHIAELPDALVKAYG